jgi:hypothetical protein
MSIIGATVADPIARMVAAVAALESHADGFAVATASNMLGNGRRGMVRRFITEAQGGTCFTCGVPLNTAPQTVAVLFRLVPSIVGADHLVSGNDAMAAGTVPGNVTVTCCTCSADRNRASDAFGTPVTVTADVMTPAMAATVTFAWPKGAGKGSDSHGFAAAPCAADDHRFSTRRAARFARFGW